MSDLTRPGGSAGGGGGGDASAANQLITNTDLTDGSQAARITGSAAQAAVGIFAKPTAFGTLQVSGSTTKLLNETFDTTLDATNVWTLTGTQPPVASGGVGVLSLAASNSISSVMASIPLFNPTTQAYVLAAQLALGAQQTNPNCHRWFGPGLVASYAATTPLDNGFGFEVDVTGALNAVVYVAGVRYVVNSTNGALITASGSWASGMFMSPMAAMTWPTNNVAIVSLQYFNGYAYFYLAGGATGLDVPIGVASWIPGAVALPVRVAAITTAAVSTVLATTFTASSLVLGVSGGTNNQVADPAFPWRQQSVDAYNRAYGVAPDLFVTGVATQTAAGNNLLLTAAGTGSTDTQAVGARSIALQIVPTGTVSSGVVTFEASNDNTTFVAIALYDSASLTANPISTVSPATGVSRYFVGSIPYRYVRARISTVIGGGGSLQALYTLSQSPYQPQITTVTQATGANLNAAISAGTITTVSTVTSVSTLAAITAGANLIADTGVQYRANATGAATIKHFISAATTNAVNVKASAGRLLGWSLLNTTAAPKYVKLHNTAGTPTAGAAVVMAIGIPANGTSIYTSDGGIGFATGIGLSATGASPDADTTATAVGDIVGDLFYA